MILFLNENVMNQYLKLKKNHVFCFCFELKMYSSYLTLVCIHLLWRSTNRYSRYYYSRSYSRYYLIFNVKYHYHVYGLVLIYYYNFSRCRNRSRLKRFVSIVTNLCRYTGIVTYIEHSYSLLKTCQSLIRTYFDFRIFFVSIS